MYYEGLFLMDVPDITNQIDDPLQKRSDITVLGKDESSLPDLQLEEHIVHKNEIENIVKDEGIIKIEHIEEKTLENYCTESDKTNKIESSNKEEYFGDTHKSSDNISQTNGNAYNNILGINEQYDIVKSSDTNSSKHNTIAVKKQYKKRRRIIITESEAESDVEFNSPPEPDAPLDEEFECTTTENEESVSEEEEEEEESLVPEKPKPKCKKQSTIIRKQLEIKKLFENAIIIPAPPIKCSISRAVISSSDEKEEDNNRPCKTSPILLRCNKRKLFESSSNDSESDSNILITEPIPDSTYDKFEIDDEPICEIVLPPDLVTSEPEQDPKTGNEEQDPITINGNDVVEDKMPFSSTTNSEEDVSTKHMPNSVYFGDVEVPLNILYTYEEENELKSTSVTDESSDESDSEKHIKRINNNNRNNHMRGHKSKGSSRSLPSARSELDKLKACVKAANIKIKYTQLFEDCTNDRERADAIRDLLEDHGLRGEPTIAKCRRLKKKVVKVRKEIAELDKSAIIESSGRTLRSAGVVHKSENLLDLYGQELLKKTMNTIRNLVDTDSD